MSLSGSKRLWNRAREPRYARGEGAANPPPEHHPESASQTGPGSGGSWAITSPTGRGGVLVSQPCAFPPSGSATDCATVAEYSRHDPERQAHNAPEQYRRISMDLTILITDTDPPEPMFDVDSFTREVSEHVETVRHTPDGVEIELTDVTHTSPFDGGMGISFADGDGYTVPGATPADRLHDH